MTSEPSLTFSLVVMDKEQVMFFTLGVVTVIYYDYDRDHSFYGIVIVGIF